MFSSNLNVLFSFYSYYIRQLEYSHLKRNVPRSICCNLVQNSRSRKTDLVPQWFWLTVPSGVPSGSWVSGERAVTRVSCHVMSCRGSINYPENLWPLHFLCCSACPRLLPDPILSISVPAAVVIRHPAGTNCPSWFIYHHAVKPRPGTHFWFIRTMTFN